MGVVVVGGVPFVGGTVRTLVVGTVGTVVGGLSVVGGDVGPVDVVVGAVVVGSGDGVVVVNDVGGAYSPPPVGSGRTSR